MEDKQFDILMKTIGGIKDRLDKQNERLDRLEEEMKRTKEDLKSIMDEQIKGFNRLEKKIDKAIFVNEREHTMIIREVGYNYKELKDENEEIRGDVNALHFLSKTNIEQHKEYDKLLSIKRA